MSGKKVSELPDGKYKRILFIIIALFLSGCTGQAFGDSGIIYFVIEYTYVTFTPSQPPTIIPKTETLTPTNEPTQTDVPPTDTPTNTPTQTATPVPTNTLTNTPEPSEENVYYFDSVYGSDSYSGNSATNAWRTLSKLNSYPFQAGDVVYLSRGSLWSGRLEITRSGVTYTAHGEGGLPIFENPVRSGGDAGSSAIRINADNVIVEYVKAQSAYYGGVFIDVGSNNNTIRNIEVTNVGIGVAVLGSGNLITQNYIHNLNMVVNTNDGGGDDFGAVGVEIFGGNNEVSYNRLIDCIAPSYDFGTDGGAVEIYAYISDVSGSSFHHNYAKNTDGFIEMHSRDKVFSADNVSIYHNVIEDVRVFFDIGMPGYGGGHELKSANNIRFEHNTFVNLEPEYSPPYWEVMSFHGVTPTAGQVYFRNNIICTPNYGRISTRDGFTHTNNIYCFNGSNMGISLSSTEKRADPLFVSKYDFHLQSSSPAIGYGADLGYEFDFDDASIPDVPSVGAYQ